MCRSKITRLRRRPICHISRSNQGRTLLPPQERGLGQSPTRNPRQLDVLLILSAAPPARSHRLPRVVLVLGALPARIHRLPRVVLVLGPAVQTAMGSPQIPRYAVMATSSAAVQITTITPEFRGGAMTTVTILGAGPLRQQRKNTQTSGLLQEMMHFTLVF